MDQKGEHTQPSNKERQVDFISPLSEAKIAGLDFIVKHKKELSPQSLKAATPEAIIILAKKLERQAIEAMGEPDLKLREMSEESLKRFIEVAKEKYPMYIGMRHGAEKPPPGTESLEEAEKKRHMMQLPDNKLDAADDHSLAEALAIGLILKYIQAKTGKKIQIRYSEHKRARWVGEAITTMTNPFIPPDQTLEIDTALNSLNYKRPEDGITIEELREGLPKGTIEWIPKDINHFGILESAPTQGRSTYDEIVYRETNAMENGLKDPNTITIDITHTQQLNVLQDKVGVTPKRLPELGMVILQKKEGMLKKIDLPNDGLLLKEAKSLTSAN